MNNDYTPTEEDLTAYALGEADEIQAAMVEKALESQPASQALLDEIREMIALSEGAFAELKGVELTDAQREKIESAAETVVAGKFPKKRRSFLLEGLAAAAVIGIMAGITIPNTSTYFLKSDHASVVPIDELEHARSSGTGYLERAQDGATYYVDDVSGRKSVLAPLPEGEKYLMREGGRIANIDVVSEDSNEVGRETQFDNQDESTGSGTSIEQRNLSVQSETHPSISPNVTPNLLLAGEQSTVLDVNTLPVSESDGPVRDFTYRSTSDLAAEPKTVMPKPAGAGGGLSGASNDGRDGVSNPAGPDGQVKGIMKLESGQEMVLVQTSSGRTESLVVSDDEARRIRESMAAGNSVVSEPELLSRLPESVPVDPNQLVAAAPPPAQIGVELQMTSTSGAAESVADSYQVAGQPPVYQWRRPENMPRPAIQPVPVTPGTEAYERIVESQFKRVGDAPLSTFSIDVDTASYANVRRFFYQSQLPPVDAVRIEEMINYFDYDYPQPNGVDPFSANIELGSAPWNPQHKIVRVGLKGKEISAEERPATNLVFLLDVSGSMNNPNKLPLLKQSLRLLTEQLNENDRVAIAVYAGSSGLVLNSTPGNMHSTIVDSLNRLQAGGSTNGGAGIQLAYDVATQNFIEGGVNRVILATDGDFNVGTTNRNDLVSLIENKAKSGVFLSVLGFGMGNLKDATMERLADKGNGNYAYIDTFAEAKKVLADEMSGTLFTIAKDVKIQVEFNPHRVQAYRLIGYENRALADRDFNDDTKDAGEIGAGHTVTALYEIVPTGVALNTRPGVDALRYEVTEETVESAVERASVDPALAQELLTVKLRYKQPDGHVSKLLTFPVLDMDRDYLLASQDFKFATAVAAFGMKLRNSPFAVNMTYDTVLSMAESGVGHDLNGYRSEFLSLVRQARSLSPARRY